TAAHRPAAVLQLRPDLWQPCRSDDRPFLFLAGGPRGGRGSGAQRRADGFARGAGNAGPRRGTGARDRRSGREWMMSKAAAGLMQGKRGLIMGLANDKSLAWGIARQLRDHGAELAFTFPNAAIEK